MAKHKHTYTAVFFHFSLFLSLQEFRFDITRTTVATLLIGWPWFRSLFEFGDTWKHNVNIPFCNCRPIVAVISDCNDAKHLITYFQFRITSSISNRLTAIFVHLFGIRIKFGERERGKNDNNEIKSIVILIMQIVKFIRLFLSFR